eukprot:200282-Chlamydomonas_euryale.AAC.1
MCCKHSPHRTGVPGINVAASAAPPAAAAGKRSRHAAPATPVSSPRSVATVRCGSTAAGAPDAMLLTSTLAWCGSAYVSRRSDTSTAAAPPPAPALPPPAMSPTA